MRPEMFGDGRSALGRLNERIGRSATREALARAAVLDRTLARKTMPDITVKKIDELEQYAGPFQKGQQFFFAGKSLGLSKLGMNIIRMPPHWEHYPEHDHAANGEEELYIPLEGSGTLHAEGQSYPMERGVLVRVGAPTRRKIIPGPEGMTLLMLSDRPDPK